MGHDAMKRWTAKDTVTLRRLAAPGTLFFAEIAADMGFRAGTVCFHARRNGIRSKPRGRMGMWNSKHVHIRKAAMTYFLTHTFGETRSHFNLTQSELKSLFTVGYRMPELKHLRKETRRHDRWSADETLFFLRHSGLHERKWIAGKLKRGGLHAVKGHTERLHGIWTKQIHGLPAKWVRERLGLENFRAIKTKAGPTGPGVDCRYLIVPWVEICDLVEAKPRRHSAEIRSCLRAMAKFQRFIYGTKTTDETISQIEKAIQGELCPKTSPTAKQKCSAPKTTSRSKRSPSSKPLRA